MSLLDRFLISQSIINLIPHLQSTTLNRGHSDHCPILLHYGKLDFGPTPFKFFHSWLSYDDLNSVVLSVFNNNEDVNPGLNFQAKLKKLKFKLKTWIKDNKSNEGNRKQTITARVHSIAGNLDAGTSNDAERRERLNLIQELNEIHKRSDQDLVQKSRHKWVVDGDENSQFFHSFINSRRSHQNLRGIMVDGNWITNPSEVKSAFYEFYKNKFEAAPSFVLLNDQPAQYKLSTFESSNLEREITETEIKQAVWDCGSSKSPGPDGFTFLFIKRFWEHLKADLVTSIQYTFNNLHMPNEAGSAFITLIPKVSNPTLIKDYRPISLIGMYYKIVSKILATRLSSVIDRVVSIEQSAFISNRQILDGPLILSETINWYKSNSKKLMILKVDFEKAYDSVNGSPTSEFDLRSGLRQGNPLSPFLFLIIVAGLHLDIKKAVESNIIKGLKINISKSNDYGINVSDEEMAGMQARMLSYGGRLTLIKSVLGSIGIYYLSLYKCPKNVLKILEGLRRSFFWGSDDETKKMSWIKWDSILSSLDKGGMGVGSLEAFNLALMFKWIWRFHTQSHHLWRKVIASIYGNIMVLKNGRGVRLEARLRAFFDFAISKRTPQRLTKNVRLNWERRCYFLRLRLQKKRTPHENRGKIWVAAKLGLLKLGRHIYVLLKCFWPPKLIN
ncbi:uncharacterized protein [Rutidosis leptorrhynchoides]|uniref:uncharacterized protein n=1 Tax=Rutidosis leptorrhynchoides TaxID=125765 RepID=UPI003A990C39